MADTVRTLSALQALLADNTDGDISAQDVRDMLVSVFPPQENTDSQRLTGGDQTFNNDGAPGDQIGSDLVVPAVSGDVVEVGIGYRVQPGAPDTAELRVDFATRVSSADVTYFSSGTGTAAAGAIQQCNFSSADGAVTNALSVFGFSLLTLASGDISSGNATIRVYGYNIAANNLVMDQDSGRPVFLYAKNLGQARV